MSDAVARFAAMHTEYRQRIVQRVGLLTDEELAELSDAVQAEVDVPSFRHLPDEQWPVAARLRGIVQREIRHRKEAG